MSKNTKIKSPVSGGVVKVPVIMQLEALECGAACLAMIMAYYDKWIPLEQVREDCGVSRDGSTAKNVALAAINYGFNVKGYSRTPELIRERGTFPCLIHWEFNHFVVLDGFKGNYAYLNDPAKGAIKVNMDAFEKAFTGITVEFSPGENFVPEGKPKSTVKFAAKRLNGAAGAVVFFMLTMAISSLFGILNPVMTRIFMDRLLTGINPDWLYPFTIAMCIFAAFQIMTQWVETIYKLKINGKMDVIGSSTYMWKVLHLPIKFFGQRMAGDIQMRKSTNATIANSLINTFAPTLLNTVMMILYLVFMLRQSLILTFVGIGTIVLNILVSRIVSNKRVNIERIKSRDSAMLSATSIAGIEMIETIKASGAESGFFQKWAGYQASVNTQQAKSTKVDNYIGAIPALLSNLANYAVFVIGIWFIMNGNFTLGSLQMFHGFLSSFMSPTTSLISVGQTIREMRTQMERVEDVMEYPSDPNANENDDEDKEFKMLKGNVELKNITFGYSKLNDPLIQNFNMKVKSGGTVAFVGSSGCGKSTLSKLISGLYDPWEGEILFDGAPRSSYAREVLTGSVAVVDQEITFFEGNIADNIRMWDKSIQDFDVIMAARDSKLHDVIMQREGGYQSTLAPGGRDLSGGQRQRMEIARVLAQDPSIIILDEATSALDAKTEYEVVEAIRERDITCIIIAHRLSTIRDCDEIIVLDKGHVAERGTHEELMALNGVYTTLVTSE